MLRLEAESWALMPTGKKEDNVKPSMAKGEIQASLAHVEHKLSTANKREKKVTRTKYNKEE